MEDNENNMKLPEFNMQEYDGIYPEADDKMYLFMSEKDPNIEYKILGDAGRYWQTEVFNEVINKDIPNVLIHAACGSGKSLVQDALAIMDSLKGRKQLIVVPQSHIHATFSGGKHGHVKIKIKDTVYTFEFLKGHNFCTPDSDEKVDGLIEFLLTSSAILQDKNSDKDVITSNIAIATHSALCHAWNKIKKMSKETEAAKDLTLVVDECHKVKGVCKIDNESFTEEQIEEIERNQTILGNIVQHIYNFGKNCRLRLTTATDFRGDGFSILEPEIQKGFYTYHQDAFEHHKTTGIKKEEIRYVNFKGKNPLNEVCDAIIKEPNEYHFAVIPSRNHKWRRKNDNSFVEDAIDKLVSSGFYKRDEILNFVDIECQDEHKQKLLDEPKSPKEGELKIKVIFTCKMGREGTDFVPCSRIHNTDPERSDTMFAQTFGRLLRKFEGKKIVRATYYYRFIDNNRENTRLIFSEMTNQKLHILFHDDKFNSFHIKMISIKTVIDKDGKETEVKEEKEVKKTLKDILGHIVFSEMLENIISRAECLESKIYKTIMPIIIEELDKYEDRIKGYNKKKLQEEIIKIVFADLARNNGVPQTKINGVDLSFLTNDENWKFDIVRDFYSFYGAKIGNKEIKKYIRIVMEYYENQLLRVNEFAEFYFKEKRKPSQFSEKNNEKSLYKWLTHKKEDFKKGNLSQSIINRFKEKNIYFLLTETLKFDQLEKFEEFYSFYEKHGKPMCRSENEKEQSLSGWLSRIKKMFKNNKLSKSIIDEFKKRNIYFLLTETMEEKQLEKFEEFYNFYTKHGKPSGDSPVEKEKKMADWLVWIKSQYKKNKLLKSVINEFKKRNLMFLLNETPDTKNIEMCDKYIVYYKKFGCPSQKSNKREEIRLAQWFYRSKRHYKNNKLLKYVIDKFEKNNIIHLLKVTYKEDQLEYVRDYANFYFKEGRSAKQNSKNPKENQKAKWFNSIKMRFKKNILSKEIMDEFKRLKIFHLLMEGRENDTFLKISRYAIFYFKKGRKPSFKRINKMSKYLIDDIEEKRKACWFHNIKKKFDKNILSKKIIREFKQLKIYHLLTEK